MITPRRIPSFVAVATLAAVASISGAAEAHFVLQAPEAVFTQGPLGDPQKAPPCGDAGGAEPTGIVTSYMGGDTVTITIDETIYHPGHYRIALALNDPSELPEAPPVTPNNTPCGTAPIDPNPAFPVLADGVFVHTQSFDGPQSIDVTLPNDIECDHCTLQIIQFMSNHGLNNPGGCYYHHCATISVHSQQGTTTDMTTSTSDGSTSGESTTGATTGDVTTGTGTSAGTTSAGTTSASTTTGGTSTGGATTGGATSAATSEGDSEGLTSSEATSSGTTDESGCSCTSGGGDALGGLLGVLGLLGLGARRRR